MTLNSQAVHDVLIAVTLIGGSILYARNRIPQQNVKQLTSLTNTYEKRIKALEDEIKSNHLQQLDNVRAIADLQGQVKVYKELPLRELADGIKEIVNISKKNAESNRAILKQLQSTAGIAAEDRDVLANSNKHIRTEVHKIIR